MSLQKIQEKLNAPKGQTNTFGGYKYRSAEDILNAVKPLLAEYNWSIVLTDEVVAVLDRVYVRATVIIMDEKMSSLYLTSAFARESLVKKGMDDSQITGSTSSYARKYALNGMFAIDDTKDADTDSYTKLTKEPEKKAPRQPDEKMMQDFNQMMDTAENLQKLEMHFAAGWKYFNKSKPNQEILKAKYDKLKATFTAAE